jgi:hypothetical protein
VAIFYDPSARHLRPMVLPKYKIYSAVQMCFACPNCC